MNVQNSLLGGPGVTVEHLCMGTWMSVIVWPVTVKPNRAHNGGWERRFPEFAPGEDVDLFTNHLDPAEFRRAVDVITDAYQGTAQPVEIVRRSLGQRAEAHGGGQAEIVGQRANVVDTGCRAQGRAASKSRDHGWVLR